MPKPTLRSRYWSHLQTTNWHRYHIFSSHTPMENNGSPSPKRAKIEPTDQTLLHLAENDTELAHVQAYLSPVQKALPPNANSVTPEPQKDAANPLAQEKQVGTLAVPAGVEMESRNPTKQEAESGNSTYSVTTGATGFEIQNRTTDGEKVDGTESHASETQPQNPGSSVISYPESGLGTPMKTEAVTSVSGVAGTEVPGSAVSGTVPGIDVALSRSAGPTSGPTGPSSVSAIETSHTKHPVNKSRLVVLAGKCLQHHILDHLRSLRLVPNVPTTEVSADRLSTFPFKEYTYVNFCIEYDETFSESLDKIMRFCESERNIFAKADEIAYHFIFEKGKKWASYTQAEKTLYENFLACLNRVAGEKVTQCSLVNKYDMSTVYVTEKEDLARLGQEIQADCDYWKNLKIFDYGENCIRFLPGVKFPDSVQVINIGGGSSLETLAGFKMPAHLKVLIASKGLIPSIDYISFPQSLERLDLLQNRIFFLNYVEFPPHLKALDLSQNRIDSLKNVVLPRGLEYFSVSHNPIECIKGVRFPETIQYLDLSCIPNESMTGIKFPDATVSLNLQQSMTNTRGLKLPPFVKELNLACDGVNSINPLRLPNSIEKLFLAHNNIKSLSKVAFPSALRELYLGNNMITTLKNVQFPPGLEVLDLEMDPYAEENEKYITTLKDVVLPPNLRILRLGYHLIKAIESMEFPYNLQELSLQYNDLRVFRNIRFGPKLRILDLSGNQDLLSVDSVVFPESLVEFRIPSLLLNNLPATVVERANKHELTLTKSMPYTI